jgi:hypothetical protein
VTPDAGITPGSFTQDIVAHCPSGEHVVWRLLEWTASVPASASIVFSAETANLGPDGGAPDWSKAQSVVLVTDTTSVIDVAAPIDTGAADGGLAGAFDLATPPVISGDVLRLTATLNPSADGTQAPVLSSWRVAEDCLASE